MANKRAKCISFQNTKYVASTGIACLVNLLHYEMRHMKQQVYIDVPVCPQENCNEFCYDASKNTYKYTSNYTYKYTSKYNKNSVDVI